MRRVKQLVIYAILILGLQSVYGVNSSKTVNTSSVFKRATQLAITSPDLQEISNSIQVLLDELSINGRLEISTDEIEIYPTFLNFYALNDYNPAWLDQENVNEACDLINNAFRHGLLPEDYHYSLIIKLRSMKSKTSRQEIQRLAYLDLLLTDGIYTYATHILQGNNNALLPSFVYVHQLIELPEHQEHTIQGNSYPLLKMNYLRITKKD